MARGLHVTWVCPEPGGVGRGQAAHPPNQADVDNLEEGTVPGCKGGYDWFWVSGVTSVTERLTGCPQTSGMPTSCLSELCRASHNDADRRFVTARAGRTVPDMTIHKAVIPAAGLGTRFLPATKATPKEMLPIVDKPAIQYVVEEAVRAGLDDVLLITGRSKRSLADHFDAAPELEQALEAKGDTERLAKVRESSELGHVHFVRQGQPKGLGHAVLQAKHHVGCRAVRGPAGRRPDRRARRAAEHDARAAGAHGRVGHRAAGGAARRRSRCTGARPWSRSGGRRRRRPGARHGPRREAGRRRGAEQPRDHRAVRAQRRGVRGPREAPSRVAAARSS